MTEYKTHVLEALDLTDLSKLVENYLNQQCEGFSHNVWQLKTITSFENNRSSSYKCMITLYKEH